MSSNKSVLITGGTVVNASGEVLADVMIDQGVVQEVGTNISTKYAAENEGGPRRIDATSCVVTSAFVDLHTHLREPGREESETIETGSRAAALGGYGAVDHLGLAGRWPDHGVIRLVCHPSQLHGRGAVRVLFPPKAARIQSLPVANQSVLSRTQKNNFGCEQRPSWVGSIDHLQRKRQGRHRLRSMPVFIKGGIY